MADVDKLSKRPAEYLWETGVAPLTVGSVFFLLGASELLRRILPQTDLAQQGIKWLAIAAVVAVFWGTRSLKDRVVSPRGGYVEPARPKWLLWLLLPAMIAPFVLVHAFTPVGSPPGNDFERLVAPGFALLFAALSLYHGRMRKVPLLYGIYLAGLALLIWWLPLSATEPTALLQAGAGGPLAVFGAMRLRAFVKANPQPVDLTTGG